MVDTQKLRHLIKNFEFYSSPTSANSSAPATVEDINKLIKNTAAVLYSFVNELEKED
ncbi:hypothetical protein [Sporomusa acidovorans]|uniref:Uncharacterized protein n=1 Tax=Sporomusa acidovorans (strain ATCC 49682 / DSM 3132 / Mol) TaxID=1123286 RepID=A0ABZ3J9B1_SPOA4|nr:hypothetical protein [Sporomusa acidovorans]OZC16048.1 hypothetical protein SPACI_44140 [Sporomusa acidovorans DSM 3132]SDD88477.1 hypothetical protein SAMN04488499_100583 [Sporomusa acidovorans]